jgi:hypothetical protein
MASSQIGARQEASRQETRHNEASGEETLRLNEEKPRSLGAFLLGGAGGI